MKPLHVQLALADMARYVALINFETAEANRELQLGGWLSDHAAGVQELEHEYCQAKKIVEQHSLQLQKREQRGKCLQCGGPKGNDKFRCDACLNSD